MKFLIIFLLPCAFAAAVPQKRIFMDTLVNTQEIQSVINQLVTFLSSDDNEAKCEGHCHTLIANQQSTTQHLCPFFCHLAQDTLAGIHVGTREIHQKRLFLDTLLNGQEAQSVINQLITFLASDDNEAKCEGECHTLIRNQQSTFQHLCPFMCHMAQNALNATHIGKRFLLDGINTAEFQAVVNQLVTLLASDDNEAKCETECHTLIRDQQSTTQHLCPFACHLAQDALNAVHLGKRMLIDTILNGEETRRIVDSLVETLGTHENEAKCENECHVLIRNQQSTFQHLCPFLCHLAIDALNNLHSPNTDPTATGKRLIVGDFINTEETARIIDQLVATLGSHESEVACEKQCHVLIKSSTSVFQHMCPFICHTAESLINNLGHHSTTDMPPGHPVRSHQSKTGKGLCKPGDPECS